MERELLYKDITDRVLKCFYDVYDTLGYGFLEKVYERAMLVRLQEDNLEVKNQLPIKVFFHDVNVGDYFADIVVEEKLILELKAEEKLDQRSDYQLLNYLKATEMEVGLVLNFGRKPEFRRKIFTNDRKKMEDGTRTTRIGRITTDKIIK